MGFFGSLFGSDQKKTLKAGKKAATKELNSGYAEAQPFYNEAFSLYEPYANSGTEANTRYNQLLGLGTEQERAAAQSTYLNDPIFSSMLNQQSNALLRQQNARGGTYGGQAVMAAGRLANEQYGSYLDRLKGQGDQGLRATDQQATLRAGQGDLRYGLGVSKAGGEQSYASARAQQQSQSVNNLLGLGSTILKGVSMFSDARLKTDIVRIGAMASGLPLYRFKYIGGQHDFEGVMAQETLEYAPWAVELDSSGYLKVRYDLI